MLASIHYRVCLQLICFHVGKQYCLGPSVPTGLRSWFSKHYKSDFTNIVIYVLHTFLEHTNTTEKRVYINQNVALACAEYKFDVLNMYWTDKCFRDFSKFQLPWRCLSGVGVTKPISSVPLFSEIFSIAKTRVSYWISRLYLTGVAAAQLRWHLSNINVIQII